MKVYETMSEKYAFSYLDTNLLRDLGQVFSDMALSSKSSSFTFETFTDMHVSHSYIYPWGDPNKWISKNS